MTFPCQPKRNSKTKENYQPVSRFKLWESASHQAAGISYLVNTRVFKEVA